MATVGRVGFPPTTNYRLVRIVGPILSLLLLFFSGEAAAGGEKSLGSIEVEVNGESCTFDVTVGSATSLVPVMKAMRIEGKGDAGDTLQVVVKPVELDKLKYPTTLKGQTAADLEPGQGFNSLRMVMLTYTDGQGKEFSSTTAHEVRIESWNERTIVGSFPGAELAARKAGSVKVGRGRFKATFSQ